MTDREENPGDAPVVDGDRTEFAAGDTGASTGPDVAPSDGGPATEPPVDVDVAGDLDDDAEAVPDAHQDVEPPSAELAEGTPDGAAGNDVDDDANSSGSTEPGATREPAAEPAPVSTDPLESGPTPEAVGPESSSHLPDVESDAEPEAVAEVEQDVDDLGTTSGPDAARGTADGMVAALESAAEPSADDTVYEPVAFQVAAEHVNDAPSSDEATATAWTPQPWGPVSPDTTTPDVTDAAAPEPGAAEAVTGDVLPAPSVAADPETTPEGTSGEETLVEPGVAPATPVGTPAASVEPPATPEEPESPEPEPNSPVPPPEADLDGGTTEPSTVVPPVDKGAQDWRARRLPRTAGRVAIAVVVLAGAYVAAAWAMADRVPVGTVVAGVEIGGLDSEDAVARLDDALAEVTVAPIPVVAGDQRTEVESAALGLTFDASATVDTLTGFGLEPAKLWRQVFGGGDADPVSAIDTTVLTAAVKGVAESLDTSPVDGTVSFVDGSVETTEAVDGIAVDVAGAQDLLAREWLTAARPVVLPTTVVTPDIDQDAVDRAIADLALPVAGAPVSVEVSDQVAEIPASVLTDVTRFEPDGSDLRVVMDGPALVEAVIARTTGLLTAPANAEFTFDAGAPVIVPGVPGTTLDPDALAMAVVTAATGAERTARVELVEADPADSAAALQALGITEVVSEFSTPLTSEPRRTGNITVGAAAINGTLVRPGETFSLTDALGPIDAEHGFVQAGAIINGEHSEAWGGGLSQVSTTTFNAAYFAGFVDVEHHPHSEWFSRYPEGREATIFTGTLDMRWQNDTPYGALVQAWVQDGRVNVRIWGTKYWTVESTTGGRSNVIRPTTVYSQSATCSPQRAGNPGFTVTVRRIITREGTVEADESWTTRYRPQNAIICGTAPAETPTPTG